MTEYKQQSKLVFRRLNANSEPACSIESGQYTLQWVSCDNIQEAEADHGSYLIVEKVIYMCICDSSYPRKLAFSYLDELSKEFQRSYGDKIESVTRPYAFMGFGTMTLLLRPEESVH